MILQKRFRQHTKLLFFKQRNNYNSLLLCILCRLFLLLSRVSIEPKRSWTLQNSILCLCFSKEVPDMGGKHFRILQGSDSLSKLYFTHTSRFGLTCCTFPYCLCLKLVNIQFSLHKLSNCISFFTYYTAFILSYLFHVQAKCI